jgi:hypothetical protein
MAIQTARESIATNNLEWNTHNQKQKINAESAEINAEVAEIGLKNDLKQGYSLRTLHQPLWALR